MLQWNRRFAVLMLLVAVFAALSGWFGGIDLGFNLHW
jgi:hypothetical protein